MVGTYVRSDPILAAAAIWIAQLKSIPAIPAIYVTEFMSTNLKNQCDAANATALTSDEPGRKVSASGTDYCIRPSGRETGTYLGWLRRYDQ